MTGMSTAEETTGRERRGELGAFLRSRRERITPADVGMPAGPRRRTPGLRREEVAQLAGVGVTWYTWLEQGRPIKVSTQVLDAVARTLRLDGTEHEHLYRLAEVPTATLSDTVGTPLPPDVQTILDGLLPLPAVVSNGRCDVLAWNAAYAALFPRVVRATGCERNSMWMMFTLPPCCNPVVNWEEETPIHVAVFRHRYIRHLGEPGWKELVERLQAVSPEFARLWAASHDVAIPGQRTKVFRHHAGGEIRTRTTNLEITASPGVRVVVYVPTDEESRDRIGWLLANPEAAAPDHTH
ncbi:helix-turn-helix domain-containing protein [Actinomadura sp. NEAU-AAG5]|uniref:Helix-turn-helix domain-containing protein n=2 Tax=Actinomadura litoris TaxID=2678616 RepID=A0A7K1KYR2_9ACTN|nr:helix-turn-helix domain-containing protein [Actinomadura litoris]